MLPLSLLNAAQGQPMLVELKNGETLNGHLVDSDTWMNLTLKEVIQTDPEGEVFTRLEEIYVKGNNIKYLRFPDELLDLAKAQSQHQHQHHGQPQGQNDQGGYRGGREGQHATRGDMGDRGGRGGGRGGMGGTRGGRGGIRGGGLTA